MRDIGFCKLFKCLKRDYVAEYNGCSANNEVNELIKKHVDEFEMKVEKVPSDWLKENRRVK